MLRIFRNLALAWPRERRCLCCSAVFRPQAGGEVLFCADCLAAMPRRERGHCPACGEPAAWPDLPPEPCPRCRNEPPAWDGFVFHGLYEGKLRNMLLALKFAGEVVNGHSLGSLLSAHPALGGIAADAVVPVPLHASRLAARGYNQALELAAPVAKRLGKPLRADLLWRVRATVPQSGNSLEQRRQNTLDAFNCSPKVQGMRVLLIDDTMTTGATLESACRTLRRAGAAGVSVAVVSRTARHQRMLRMR